MIKFEKVKRFQDVDFDLPQRKTAQSAGYDFVVAEDIIIPPAAELMHKVIRAGTTVFSSDSPATQAQRDVSREKMSMTANAVTVPFIKGRSRL